jgi:hypothetical protein
MAWPILAEAESLEAFLAGDEAADGFDPDVAGDRHSGFVRLNQLALEHLIGGTLGS